MRADDPACTPAWAMVLHGDLAESGYVELEGAALLAKIEKPVEFNAAELVFLDGVV